MTTSMDINLIIAFWDRSLSLSSAAQTALETAFSRRSLVVAAPAFAELLVAPGRNEAFIDGFLEDTAISVEWNLDEMIWRVAGRTFQRFAERRRKQRDSGTRRILTDFLIGAHAETRGYRLLTLDERIYHATFPKLVVEII